MARIVGKQRKLDFNKNNKLDKQDFKILAKIKKYAVRFEIDSGNSNI